MSEAPGASSQSGEGREHRFLPGQEKEARAFLEQPSRFEPYRMLIDRFALWMMFIIWPISLGFYWLISDDPDSFWLQLGFSLAMLLGGLGLSTWKLVQTGWFVLDPDNGEVIHAGQRISFAKVKHPKVRSFDRTYMSGMFTPYQGAEWGIEYKPGSTLMMSASMSRKKLEHLVDLLTEMAAEYQEKDAVRCWLSQQSDGAPGGPFRQGAAGADASLNASSEAEEVRDFIARQRDPEARVRRSRSSQASSGDIQNLEGFLDNIAPEAASEGPEPSARDALADDTEQA